MAYDHVLQDIPDIIADYRSNGNQYHSFQDSAPDLPFFDLGLQHSDDYKTNSGHNR